MTIMCLSDANASKKAKFSSENVESTDGVVDGYFSDPKPEELNKKALQIIQRVRDKLTGSPSDIVNSVYNHCHFIFGAISKATTSPVRRVLMWPDKSSY